MAYCLLCEPQAVIPDDQVLDHLRYVHDEDVDVATWPDGGTVILDTTLDPEDFLPPAVSLSVCGWCAGIRPGEEEPAAGPVTACPCCHQYASVLYDVPCGRNH